MAVSMKYRTQGSLPIGTQHKPQYIPKIPEEPAQSNRGKVKQESPILGRIDEDVREELSSPRVVAPPAPQWAPYSFRKPTHDPCRAIIETSPYYVYFKIVTTKDTETRQDKDLKSVLSDLTTVDQDLPRTAKYRHFRSYEQ
ncbi:uncharacterized protein RB166_007213 [Leptodactylus fuscus]